MILYDSSYDFIRFSVLRAYTKIDFLLINRSWQPTLSLSFALNKQEKSHGHQDRFTGHDLAYPGCLVGADRTDSGAGKTTRDPTPYRVLLDAIIFVLRSGCPWQAIPPQAYAPGSTVHGRFRQWVKQGLFIQAWQTMLHSYDKQVGIA